MEKTTNYQLPQWAADDPVRREDFNEAMAKIDTGIATAGHVAGYYTGNGQAMADGGQYIYVGFQPSVVIISRGWTSNSATGSYFLVAGTKRTADLDAMYFNISPNGFWVGTGGGTGTLNLNSSGINYTYIVFR